MKRVLAGCLAVLLACLTPALPAAAESGDDLPSEQYRALAEHWAPTVYQDVNESYLYRADIPTRFDYDGDWLGANNWENLENYPQIPSAYFSVRETLTHYFIEYDFYYPRDDGPIALERHENDLEGCILVIRKDSSTYGSLHLMETQAHNHWYQYSNDPPLRTAPTASTAGFCWTGIVPNSTSPQTESARTPAMACWPTTGAAPTAGTASCSALSRAMRKCRMTSPAAIPISTIMS